MREMTCRERMLTACRRGVPDRVPRALEFEHGFATSVRKRLARDTRDCDEARIDLEGHFRNDARRVRLNPPRTPGDFSRYFNRTNVEIGEWGNGQIWDSTRHYAEYIYPLANAERVSQIDEYPWPDWLESYRYEGLVERVADLKRRGFAVCGGPGAYFELAWQIRSMERLMEDMLLNEKMAFAVYDRILERNVRYARECARAGVDILYLGDDVSMQTGLMMSVGVWRKYLAPGMRAVITAAREIKPDMLVFYHSDGNITDLVPDLIEVGLDILNPVQPECVDPAQLKRTFGGKLAFWGGLGVQSIIPFGSAAEVREHVRSMIEVLGRGGGYVVAPSHWLERDTPWENLLAMVAAIDEYGSY
jgi:uroporphyrinogen decarboxylase